MEVGLKLPVWRNNISFLSRKLGLIDFCEPGQFYGELLFACWFSYLLQLVYIKPCLQLVDVHVSSAFAGNLIFKASLVSVC